MKKISIEITDSIFIIKIFYRFFRTNFIKKKILIN